MAGFSVNIGADTAQLSAGLSKAAAEVHRFNAVIETASPTTALTTLNNVVSTTAHSFDELAASAAALARIEASINQAGDAAINAGSKFDTLGGRLPLDDMNKFNSAINQLKKDLASGFKPTIINPNFIPPSVPPTLEKVQAKSKQAGAAILDFSRIVQDAPYAANNFGSIANNIDPAVGSFSRLSQEAKRLSAETGQNVTTLSLLKQSLMGGAGIGLAISAVTSIMTAAQMKYGSLGAAINALVLSTSEAAKIQKELGKAFAEAEGRVAGEVANINALLSVARDETLSKKARAEAINKLNSEYDSYLPKLTQENISTKEVTDSVNKLSESLLRQAKIKGVQDLISKETAKQAELMTGSLEDNATAWGSVVAAVKSLGAGRNFFTEQQIAGAKATGEAYQQAQTRIEKFNKVLQELTTDEAVAGTLFDETKHKKEEDLLKKRLDALEKIKAITKDATALVGLQEAIFELQVKIAVRDQVKNQLSKEEVNQLIEGYRKELQKAFNQQAIELEAIPKVKFSQVNRAELPSNIDSVIAKATGFDKKIPLITLHEARVKILGTKLTEKIEFQEKIARELNTAINDAIKGLKIDSITSVAEAIGESLTGGDIQNVFKSLFTVIANGLQQFGKALIAYGLAQKAFQVATKSLNPTIAIAAGAGLIIAGAVLKASLPKFATGGIVNGPIVGQIGEMHRPEVIMPLDRLPQMLRSIGGGGGNDFQLIPIFNSEQLYLMAKRGERRVGRKY